MWSQPPPPVADWWTLHIALCPHEVDEVLRDLCIHKHARPATDPDFPAYLAGTNTPTVAPAWMSMVHTELQRRGIPSVWCTPACPHHATPRSARNDTTRT
ncbi:hypothetical protein [Couchioplanes azureus]|uniref:hypothetical protein n=1 Tax=Couchioplanes caeruleus TaxID=56438 RepID=UPI00166FB28B|nr:hypothetical protein [Couchioplanes caeruleus]GGQ38189.1 hypothetical protein GCM10010166_00720 [Couchioplanes caeruleus subsp. azureus]